MPYVTPEKRNRLDRDLLSSKTAGELGYVLAVVCDAYLVQGANDSDTGGFRYQHISDVVGTLESIKLDLYRKEIAPYEERVEKMNGRVWTAHLPAAARRGATLKGRIARAMERKPT